jgi:hypothetical protein
MADDMALRSERIVAPGANCFCECLAVSRLAAMNKGEAS